MKIYNFEDINKVLSIERDFKELLKNQREAFINYSMDLINVPLPMQFEFHNPFGDCHVKGADSNTYNNFVIKISSGFYDIVPTSDGVILLLSRMTGKIEAVFHEGSYLTILRTALAACLAVQITPFNIEHIGIIGSGRLANQIIQLIELTHPELKISLYARNSDKTRKIASQYKNVTDVSSIKNLVVNNGVIISTTASSVPVLNLDDIDCSNLHIIGLGADCIGKQEIDSKIFGLADMIIVDSITQATKFGDTYNAIKSGTVKTDQLIDLGSILNNGSNITDKNKFLISNFTGIGAQDLAITEFINTKLTA